MFILCSLLFAVAYFTSVSGNVSAEILFKLTRFGNSEIIKSKHCELKRLEFGIKSRY